MKILKPLLTTFLLLSAPADAGIGRGLNNGKKVLPRIEILAGRVGGDGNSDGSGENARLSSTSHMIFDSSDNLYLLDGCAVRKMNTSGVITTFAGQTGQCANTNGTGTAARFGTLKGIAIDSSGNIFVSDSFYHNIRKITPAGVTSTFAGDSTGGHADGTGTAARFFVPLGLAIDSSDNVYVADSMNRVIRKITSAGVVTTYAGQVGVQGSANGTGTSASFYNVMALAVDASDNLYATDTYFGGAIRLIVPAGAVGIVSTFAGSMATSGNTNATGTSARFDTLTSMTIDSSGNFFVGDTLNTNIRKVTSAAVVTNLAGTTTQGCTDGTGTSARFSEPGGIAVNSSGDVYVADKACYTLRKVTSAGVATTVAGLSPTTGTTNGNGPGALLSYPIGITGDSSGNVYVVDSGNNRIRKITQNGTVTTHAGSSAGTTDATGTSARFNSPQGILTDTSGDMWVSDYASGRLRKVTSGAVVTTLVSAGISHIRQIGMDSSGNFYAPALDGAIVKITSAGVVSTLAGASANSGYTDSPTGTSARFNSPRGLVVDSTGNIFVADMNNHVIRKITSAGVVTTVAGSSTSGYTDGTGTAARFNKPSYLAIDSSNNIYIADTGNYTVRKMTPSFVVTTIAGNPLVSGTKMDSAPSSLGGVTGVAVVGNRLYITVPNAVLFMPLP